MLLIFARMSGVCMSVCVCMCACVCVCVTERALITPSSPTPRADISQVCVIIVNTQPPKHPVNLNQKEEHTHSHVHMHTNTKNYCVLSVRFQVYAISPNVRVYSCLCVCLMVALQPSVLCENLAQQIVYMSAQSRSTHLLWHNDMVWVSNTHTHTHRLTVRC